MSNQEPVLAAPAAGSGRGPLAPGDERLALGLDIGGTKVAAGVVRADGRIVERTRIPTPQDGAEKVIVTALLEVIDGLRALQPQVEAIGVGAAGLVQWPAGLVVGGRPYRGVSGLGAEVGHMIVALDGAPCSCGSRGCLEAMVSGTAVERLGREAVLADPEGGLARRAGDGEVSGPLVFEAARAGDPTARALFERMGFWLGVGIASLVTIFDPELVVVGGGLVTTGDLLLGPARTSFKRYVFAP